MFLGIFFASHCVSLANADWAVFFPPALRFVFDCFWVELSKWAILGGCIAVFGVVVMAALLIYCCCFAKRRQKPATPSAQAASSTEPTKSVS